MRNDEQPVILGGDHTIAIGTFSAVSAAGKSAGSEVGLIWFDAHADINTPETSTTGNIHGMPLAILLGQGPSELTDIGGFSPKLDRKYFAHVGARDLDFGERSRVLGLVASGKLLHDERYRPTWNVCLYARRPVYRLKSSGRFCSNV